VEGQPVALDHDALVGGIATLVASYFVLRESRTQARNTYRAQLRLARAAADHDRRQFRRAVGMPGAVELLGIAGELLRLVGSLGGHDYHNPRIHQPRDSADPCERAVAAGQSAILILGSDDLQRRWSHMIVTVQALSQTATMPAYAGSDQDPDSWPAGAVPALFMSRCREDTAAFIRYVQRSLRAYIDDVPLPPSAKRPYFRRKGADGRADAEVWKAPDDPDGSSADLPPASDGA